MSPPAVRPPRHRTLIGVGARAQVPSQPLLDRAPRAGDRLGPYQLCVELARGGMATLFLARTDGRAGLHRFVALKCIRAELAEDDRFLAMFFDEARIATQVHHANICNVIDFDCRRGVHYIAMEFLRGQNLGALRRRLDAVEGTPASPDPARRAGVVARIIADAAEGLHAAHELRDREGKLLDVVHRDVSPENIFVTYDGTVKLLDFGVAASHCQQHHTRTGVIKGKYGYLQPEVLAGQKADRRSDVWCLGVVTWELLTGTRLFERASEPETLQAIINADLKPPSAMRPGLPEALDAIVMRALDRDPAARFPTARELGRALIRFLVEQRLAIGLPEVAETVNDLFPDGRDAMHKLLEQAEHLQQTTPAGILALPPAATEDDDAIEIELPDDHPIEAGTVMQKPPRIKPPFPWRVLAPALGGLAVMLLVLLWHGSRSAAQPAGAATAPPPAGALPLAAAAPVADSADRPSTINIVLFQFAQPAA
ncbi:MAG TPA: serine/threonine-protein kinase, partial [Kofleriaceae bacterium]|nr:serine/threonine-protein kinase [Kofleriaceae bacterium]